MTTNLNWCSPFSRVEYKAKLASRGSKKKTDWNRTAPEGPDFLQVLGPRVCIKNAHILGYTLED